MNIDTMSAVAAVLLAISLAGERLVTAVKAAFPWLAQEAKKDDGTTDRSKDRWRRLAVLTIAYLAAWVTSAFAAGGSLGEGLTGHLTIAGVNFPTPIVAILASGGSAWWTNIVAYASAAKDARANDALAVPTGKPAPNILRHPDVVAAIEKTKAAAG